MVGGVVLLSARLVDVCYSAMRLSSKPLTDYTCNLTLRFGVGIHALLRQVENRILGSVESRLHWRNARRRTIIVALDQVDWKDRLKQRSTTVVNLYVRRKYIKIYMVPTLGCVLCDLGIGALGVSSSKTVMRSTL